LEYFQKGLIGKYSCKFTIRKSDKRKISGFGTPGKDKYSRSDSTGSPDLEYFQKRLVEKYSKSGKMEVSGFGVSGNRGK